MNPLFTVVFPMIWMTSGMGAYYDDPGTPPTNINNGITMSGDEEYLDVAYNPSEEKIYFTGYDGLVYSSYQDGTGAGPVVVLSELTGPLALITLTTRSIGCNTMLEIILSGMRTWMARLHCQYCQTEIMRL